MKHTELTIDNSPLPVPDNRMVLFLDFDDVLCLNSPYGGYDVITALSQVEKKTGAVRDFKDIWANLFARDACSLLEKINAEFAPLYVISTSWRHFLNRDAFVTVLMNTGLEFVARHLHEHWETPIFPSPQRREREICRWLEQNPDYDKKWVVLDDEISGTGYGEDYPVKQNLPFIVLCREDHGLEMVEYEKLRAAFELRRSMNVLQFGGPHDNAL